MKHVDFEVYYGNQSGRPREHESILFSKLINKLPAELRLKEIGLWSEWSTIIRLKGIDFNKAFINLRGEKGAIQKLEKICEYLECLPEIQGYCLNDAIAEIKFYTDQLSKISDAASGKRSAGGRGLGIPRQLTKAIGYMESQLMILLKYNGLSANQSERCKTISVFLNTDAESIRSESKKAIEITQSIGRELNRFRERRLSVGDVKRLLDMCSPWIIDELYDELAESVSPPKLEK